MGPRKGVERCRKLESGCKREEMLRVSRWDNRGYKRCGYMSAVGTIGDIKDAGHREFKEQ